MKTHDLTINNGGSLDVELVQPIVGLQVTDDRDSDTDNLDYNGVNGRIERVRSLNFHIQPPPIGHSEPDVTIIFRWAAETVPRFDLPDESETSPTILISPDATLLQTVLIFKIPKNTGRTFTWEVGGEIPGFVLKVVVKRKAA